MKSQNTSFPGRILSRITRQAPSVSACLQPSHSAQASLHCPALSNHKRIRKKSLSGAGPEEGSAGRQCRKAVAGRQVLCSVPPLPNCTGGTLVWQAFLRLFSKTGKRGDKATPVNRRVRRQGFHFFFSYPVKNHILNRSISSQFGFKNQH